jgi:hypothetical protein
MKFIWIIDFFRLKILRNSLILKIILQRKTFLNKIHIKI